MIIDNKTVTVKEFLPYRVTERTGKVAGMKLVHEDDDVMLISVNGTIIRIHCRDISILGRATQGVTLMRMNEDNYLMDVARVLAEEQ